MAFLHATPLQLHRRPSARTSTPPLRFRISSLSRLDMTAATPPPGPLNDPIPGAVPVSGIPPPPPPPPSPPSPVDADVRPVPTDDLKRELLSSASSTNRGLAATPYQRDAILALIAQLERASPAEAPVDNPALLSGVWRLLFTDSLSVLSLGLLAPVAVVGPIYQNLTVAVGKDYAYDVENVVELEPVVAPVANMFLGRTVGVLKLATKAKRKSETQVDLALAKVTLRQESVGGIDLVGRLPPLNVNLERPAGVVETTFLDEDLRIVREPLKSNGKERNVFVLLREV